MDVVVLVRRPLTDVTDGAHIGVPLVSHLGELLGEVGDGGIRSRGDILGVHVIVEPDILDGAVDILVDVVVKQILVDTHQEDELTHRGNEAAVAFEDEGTVGGSEFLEVADLSERIEYTGDADKAADKVAEGSLGDEVDPDFFDRSAVVSDTIFLIPGILAPDGILGRSGRHDFGEGLVVAEGVSGLVTAGHLADVILAVGEDHVQQTAGSDFPSLRGGEHGSIDVERPRRVHVVVLVARVAVILAAGLADRDEVDVLPGGSICDEVLVLGLHGTDGSGPYVETLHEFLCEILEGDAGRIDILRLGYGNLQSVGHISATDDDGAGALVARVGIGGDGNDGGIGRVTGYGLDVDPALCRGCGPFLLRHEGGAGRLSFSVERNGLGLEFDVRHLHAIQVGGELDILHRVIDVLGDVVVQQVLVETGGNEPHAHGAHETAQALFDDAFVGIGAEDLIVADLAQGLDAGNLLGSGLTGEEPRGEAGDHVDANLALVDGLGVVGAFIPGILAPDIIVIHGRDGLLEGSAVPHRVLEGIAVRLPLGGAFLRHHVHDTAEGDAPGLGGGVLLAVDRHGEVRLVLGIVLVHAVGIGTAGVRNRNEVDVMPGRIVIRAVRTVRRNGADRLLPDVQDADELLGEALQRSRGGEILRGNRGREGTAVLVGGQGTEHRHGSTVGGESDGARTGTGDDRLVRDRQLVLHRGEHPLGDVHKVFGAFGDLGAVLYGNLLLVVAVALGMVGGLVVDDVNRRLVAGGEIREQLGNRILILRQGQRRGADLERGGNGGVLFPRSIGCRRGIEQFRCIHGRYNVRRDHGFRFRLLAGLEGNRRNERCQGVPK